MARDEGRRRASVKPADAEKGGVLGIPAGAEFLIIDAEWTEWGEFGEKALKRGRKASDPVLKLTAEVKGADEPIIEGLGAGKGERLAASRDGEHLEIPEGSGAAALSDMSNAQVFLDTVFYRDKTSRAFKMHGKKAVKDDVLDDGIRAALIGLRGVAGREIVKRDIEDDPAEAGGGGRGQGKPRPTLICAEIIDAPDGTGKPPKGGSRSSSRRKDEDEDEDRGSRGRGRGRDKDKDDDDEDERPSRSRSRDKDDDDDRGRGSRSRGRDKKDEDEDEEDRGRGKKTSKDKDSGDLEEAAENALVDALDTPKYRKGVPLERAFGAIFSIVREEKDADDIAKFGEDEDWLKDRKRPWNYDKDENAIVKLEK